MDPKIIKSSDNEIYKLLMSSTENKIPIIKLHRISVNELLKYNQEKIANSSDSEELFEPKVSSSKNMPIRKSKNSLKIKLRRSTEHSNYKIDNESKRKVTKNKKENNDPVISPRRVERLRSRPKRLSDYECDIHPIVSSLRSRRTINYNEDLIYDDASSKHNKRACTFSKDIENSNYKQHGITQKRLSKVSNNNEESKECVDDIQFRNIIDTPKKAIKRISRTTFTSTIDENSDDNEDSFFSIKKNRQSVRNKVLENEGIRDNNYKEIDNLCDGIMTMSESVLTSKRKNDRQEQEIPKNIKNNVRTTKSSLSMKYNNLTPSMERRATLLIKPSTPLQQSRSKLHVSVVPKSLPCREEEFNNIFTFLEGKLMDKCGGCIYISGVPGTGKTATVNEVIRCLKRSVEKGKLDDFNFFEINGMKLTEPRQAYVQIWKQLSGKTCTWEKAYRELEMQFINKNSKRPMTLLLVDELDLLCTKRQDVIYNLLDWPTKANAQLVVITIANTMDLPERVFMGRVTSRLGLTRLTFQPYNHKQLQEIVLTRLKDTDAFRSEAIQLVARKVSAVSGDARRALDICRRATEITEIHGRKKVIMEDVNEALLEMIENSKVQAIKHCSKMEQMFLQAVSAEVTRTSIEEACFKNIYNQLCSMCSFEGIKIPTLTEILAICGRLEASRLLIRDNVRMDIHQRILLNASADDIHFALQPIDLN
ncbi:origin recognition complex subunit 1 [Vespa crabro]|uniref:origin recognition complex subunit 1 n=1 Tax=Vespa crabro TaxID=7445 RepID=UPI001F0205B8|nr:origin recognition complex subunit 1 [Vespa crabro]XP_046823184.1 origin recognition complex subunit 1 [Vespa crabro]XP_046823185.1 origin recognition complex subunit 1 [Vespa crabro]